MEDKNSNQKKRNIIFYLTIILAAICLVYVFFCWIFGRHIAARIQPVGDVAVPNHMRR